MPNIIEINIKEYQIYYLLSFFPLKFSHPNNSAALLLRNYLPIKIVFINMDDFN